MLAGIRRRLADWIPDFVAATGLPTHPGTASLPASVLWLPGSWCVWIVVSVVQNIDPRTPGSLIQKLVVTLLGDGGRPLTLTQFVILFTALLVYFGGTGGMIVGLLMRQNQPRQILCAALWGIAFPGRLWTTLMVYYARLVWRHKIVYSIGVFVAWLLYVTVLMATNGFQESFSWIGAIVFLVVVVPLVLLLLFGSVGGRYWANQYGSGVSGGCSTGCITWPLAILGALVAVFGTIVALLCAGAPVALYYLTIWRLLNDSPPLDLADWSIATLLAFFTAVVPTILDRRAGTD